MRQWLLYEKGDASVGDGPLRWTVGYGQQLFCAHRVRVKCKEDVPKTSRARSRHTTFLHFARNEILRRIRRWRTARRCGSCARFLEDTYGEPEESWRANSLDMAYSPLESTDDKLRIARKQVAEKHLPSSSPMDEMATKSSSRPNGFGARVSLQRVVVKYCKVSIATVVSCVVQCFLSI